MFWNTARHITGRVDEVNDPAKAWTHKGNVWSFTTELEAYPVGYTPTGIDTAAPLRVTATASSMMAAFNRPEQGQQTFPVWEGRAHIYTGCQPCCD